MIYELRGQRVILDVHIAKIFQIKEKTLKQLIGRNLGKLSEKDSFKIFSHEKQALILQNEDLRNELGRRFPYAFNVYGLYFLMGLVCQKLDEATLEAVKVALNPESFDTSLIDPLNLEKDSKSFNAGVSSIKEGLCLFEKVKKLFGEKFAGSFERSPQNKIMAKTLLSFLEIKINKPRSNGDAFGLEFFYTLKQLLTTQTPATNELIKAIESFIIEVYSGKARDGWNDLKVLGNPFPKNARPRKERARERLFINIYLLTNHINEIPADWFLSEEERAEIRNASGEAKFDLIAENLVRQFKDLKAISGGAVKEILYNKSLKADCMCFVEGLLKSFCSS